MTLTQRYGLSDTLLQYGVRRSKRAKRGRIIVSAQGIEVVMPWRMSLVSMQRFVESKKQWIETHWNHFQTRQMKEPVYDYNDDVFVKQRLFYQGRYYPFQLIHTNVARIEIVFDKQIGFHCLVPMRIPPSRLQRDVNRGLHHFLESSLRQRIDQTLANCGITYGLRPMTVAIRQQKTLWGSCSATGHIRLNRALSVTPEAVQSYIIIHELCHLKHMNHSPSFWKLVMQICPKYKECERWLKEHRTIIHYLPPMCR